MVESNEKRFLNSGGFMGYASDIYEMISSQDEIKDEQLFFTKFFFKESTKRSIVRALNSSQLEIRLLLS